MALGEPDGFSLQACRKTSRALEARHLPYDVPQVLIHSAFPCKPAGKVLNPWPPPSGPRREGLEGEAQPRGVMVCPRCGQPISYIEKHKRGNRVYYYAVHYEGYERTPDGRIHKKVRRCYLGPSTYVEVSKLHADLGLTFKGLIEEGRERDYMDALASTIEGRLREGSLRPEEALELAAKLERLAELARRLRDYAAAKATAKEEAEAVNDTVAKAQPLESPSTASQPQAASTQGTEDIDRELKELLKELKAS